ncbi:MAG: hypothetical protein A2Z21_02870 [Candidatus Fraserbacteria bacterium RBG_16_55_9]|uniref:PKD domain-containing protein n=1 Tax=Fraserbacteria sp. (strain RBG_16_55_9) TaxID=1817864 RepID=A0A1F5UUX1_FRAXR|nr:MAG: hypothetical protein A2Z21_02870 [Candidatus Fraserbacteria bacterium RBG_16_55_9]
MNISKRELAILWLISLVMLSGCSAPNQSPTAKITNPQEGVSQGSIVEFQGHASDPDGRIQTYHWSFGDGETNGDLQPTHTYAQSGEYRVEFSVTDDRSTSARDAMTIQVQVGPKAIATLRPAQSDAMVILQHISGEAPLTVAFDGLRSTAEPGANIAIWEWDFGDGEKEMEPSPVHIYTRSGEYQPVLTVTDDRGRASQAELSVQVSSYEAVEATLQVKDLTLRYALYDKQTKTASAGPSMIYQYVVDAPRKLTEEEIRAVLEDIVKNAQQRPRVSRITAYLFSKTKTNFMVPRDYDHYLGNAVWDNTELPEKAFSFSVSRAYLSGKTMAVLGYTIREDLLKSDDSDCGELCESHRIALVEIAIQDEPICRGLLLNTIREIARWRLSADYDGFLVNVYSKDGSQSLAQVLGMRGQSLTIQQLPTKKFINLPSQWDVKDQALWIHFGQAPAC